MDPDFRRYLHHALDVTSGDAQLVALDPATMKGRTFEALRKLLLAKASRSLLVVIEDAHWIDRTSEEFLTELVDELPSVPVLLLATYRPGYNPPWLGKSFVTQIALRPLSREAGERIVAAILGDTNDATERIVGRGEGNPFFLEELARAARQETDSRSDGSIPTTVQDVLAARIDGLDAGDKSAVQVASVLGREFSLDLIESVWDGDGAAAPGPGRAQAARVLARTARRDRADVRVQARADPRRCLRRPTGRPAPVSPRARRRSGRALLCGQTPREVRAPRVPLLAELRAGTRRGLPRACQSQGLSTACDGGGSRLLLRGARDPRRPTRLRGQPQAQAHARARPDRWIPLPPSPRGVLRAAAPPRATCTGAERSWPLRGVLRASGAPSDGLRRIRAGQRDRAPSTRALRAVRQPRERGTRMQPRAMGAHAARRLRARPPLRGAGAQSTSPSASTRWRTCTHKPAPRSPT